MPVIALCFVVWQWVFSVTEFGPPPSFLLCHHHRCNRAEDGNKKPGPRVKAKSEELCWLWHWHESPGRICDRWQLIYRMPDGPTSREAIACCPNDCMHERPVTEVERVPPDSAASNTRAWRGWLIKT